MSRNPSLSEDDAAVLVAAHIKAKQPKNYGYYRVGAIRDLGGSHKLTPKMDPNLRLVGLQAGEISFISKPCNIQVSNKLYQLLWRGS